MSPRKTIKQVIPTEDVVMGNLTIGQPLPTQKVKQVSPFLLLHHLGPLEVEPGKNPMDIGPHPHRGFAPVTFVFSGEVAHRDSLGNEQVVSGGGVQWMSAGSGIVHSEQAGSEMVRQGGTFEIIQLWVNLPSELKMSSPSYQPFQREEIPSYKNQRSTVNLNVISGTYQGLKGPVDHPLPIEAYTIQLKPSGNIVIPVPEEWNLLLYQLAGAVTINHHKYPVEGRQLVVFNQDGNEVEISCSKSSRLLLVTAPPIPEPMAQYGPFVMNRAEELQQAIEDYQSGKMGVL